MNLSNSEDYKHLYDYHKHNLIYIGEYIKFADGKAGIALGATLVMLSFFGKQSKDKGFSNLSFGDYSLLIGLIPLVVACYFFIWKVLWPRYSNTTIDYMSWGGIGSFNDSQAYVLHIEQVRNEQFIHDMGHQNYKLAEICIRKYENLKYGFISLTIGAIIETISWFFTK